MPLSVSVMVRCIFSNLFYVFIHSHLNMRGGWKNLRKLRKPDTQHNFREIRECKQETYYLIYYEHISPITL